MDTTTKPGSRQPDDVLVSALDDCQRAVGDFLGGKDDDQDQADDDQAAATAAVHHDHAREVP
jgi:hypothetical protein